MIWAKTIFNSSSADLKLTYLDYAKKRIHHSEFMTRGGSQRIEIFTSLCGRNYLCIVRGGKNANINIAPTSQIREINWSKKVDKLIDFQLNFPILSVSVFLSRRIGFEFFLNYISKNRRDGYKKIDEWMKNHLIKAGGFGTLIKKLNS